MYLSIEQLADSLQKLDRVHPFFGTSFLAFKELDLQISMPKPVDIADQETTLLDTYYNPVLSSQYYYVPLRAGGKKDRWVMKNKYSDSSLQKMRTSTFKDVFIHPKASNDWAWHPDYISLLSAFQQRHGKIPVFHLAVWMFRDQSWPDETQPGDIIEYFFTKFNISEDEKEALFDTTVDEHLLSASLLQNEPITWKQLRELIENPKDAPPDEGGGLDRLELVNVGPAKHIALDFGSRLNIITGDNGLGKTFLLECAWWALSGRWADPDQPAYPRPKSTISSIRFHVSGSSPGLKTVTFDKARQIWPVSGEKRPVLPGVVIYARVDGSCVIWDPAKHYWQAEEERARGEEANDAIRLSANEVWDGRTNPKGRGNLCNGLIYDWVIWQSRPTIGAFSTFSSVLEKLSPHPREFSLIPGEPTKLFYDDRDIPTIKLPYGEVPVVLLSAGIKRILSFAYLLVWTWEGHKIASRKIGKPPQSKIVFLIDEMEAHLHPQWQRVIVPALIEVIKMLEKQLEVQLFIATHSPLILASVEPIFDERIDSLFTLDLIDKEIEAKEIPYIKYGSINSWLTSDVFDLKRPYSLDAESALIEAKELQLSDHPDPERIRAVSRQLTLHLPEIDPFWPRWKFFAERNGVDL